MLEEANMTLFDMSGKVAVVTGSSRGIGRAIAEQMAEHGANVVISSRKQAVCDEVAKSINDKAGKRVALALAARSPLLRIGEPDEIAGAAVFLASRAGSFTTGQTLVIDGGATIS
jgi:NAD(P)-dependent dehydrogenase (short-subunit alcohol dehydrogenase family)